MGILLTEGAADAGAGNAAAGGMSLIGILLFYAVVIGAMWFKGLLFTSHDPSAVAAAADRVLLLRDGAISGEIRLAGEQEDRIAQVIALLSQT